MEGVSSYADQKIDIEALFSIVRESMPPQSERLITIPNIPETLRNILNFPNWIEPNMISIGPYHHGCSDLQEGEKLIVYSKQEPYILYQKIIKKNKVFEELL